MNNQFQELHQEISEIKRLNAELETKLTRQTEQFQDLQENHKLLQLVLDNIPCLIFWKDTNLVFQGCNQQWAKAAGFSNTEQVIGKTDYDLYPNATNIEIYLQKDIQVINSAEPEYQIEYKENKDVWYDTRKIPIKDNQGNVVGILATIEDITKRKKAEESLKIAEENYRSIFENSPEGIFQSSPEGRFIKVNPALSKIYGYDSPNEMIKSITNIGEQIYVDPEKRSEFRKLIDKQGLVDNFEYRCYCKDKSIIWTKINARAVKDSSGKILYYEGVVQDITERKNHEPDANPIFYKTLQTHFPGSLPMSDYIKNTYNTLNSYGFNKDESLGMVAICRDEITEVFIDEVTKYWGKTFNCCSLAGFVMMGKTGLAAATDHTPIIDGIRRFTFYAMPHIAISKNGEIGKVYRGGIEKASHACGALDGIVHELQSGHLQLMTDMQDIEQSIIRQKILSTIKYGDKPNLVEITKLASQIISQDVEKLLSSLDISIFNYAVMTGIQIHGPLDTHWIYPLDFYVLSSDLPDGKKNLHRLTSYNYEGNKFIEKDPDIRPIN